MKIYRYSIMVIGLLAWLYLVVFIDWRVGIALFFILWSSKVADDINTRYKL